MFYFLLKFILPEFYQYLVICIFSTFEQKFQSQKDQAQVLMAWLYMCIINPMYIQQLREVILPSIQNAVRICKQITLFTLYQVPSMRVTILKSFMLLCKSLVFLLVDVVFGIFPLFAPKTSARFMSYIVHIISIYLPQML
jgi:hypothetical protein